MKGKICPKCQDDFKTYGWWKFCATCGSKVVKAGVVLLE